MPSQPSRRGLAPPARVAELLDLAKAERWPEVLATLDELPPQAVNALPRPRRWAVIHHAAAFAPLRVLKELVRRKADWEKSTADGMSPLQVALDSPCEDRLPVVKHLLVLRGTRKGVDLEQEAHRLLDDAREGQWEAVYARLDACPELVNVLPDPRKYTVFHQAAFHGALEVLRHLVERYQANPQAPSRDGKTALQIAVEQRHGPAIEYLGALAPALVLQDCLVDFPPQQFVEIEDPGTLRELQGFLDRSRKLRDNWTRDRGYACKGSRQHKPVPSDFRLVGAVRNENVALWRMYSVHREVLKLECQRYTEGVEPFTPWVPWTHEGDAEHCPEEPGANLEAFQLSTAANEWLLFHGSSSSALESIAKEGFNMNKVGQGAVKDWGPQALPLYGFGAYCCESITKGDEYARTRAASGRFEGCRGIGLVRVLGGRYLHTCDDSLPKRTLHEKVLHGPHHSTLGDRLALRGTFREYVTYDASSLYLEYILYYKRAYAPEDLPAVSEEDLDS